MEINEKAVVKLKEIMAESETPETQMLRITFGGYG